MATRKKTTRKTSRQNDKVTRKQRKVTGVAGSRGYAATELVSAEQPTHLVQLQHAQPKRWLLDPQWPSSYGGHEAAGSQSNRRHRHSRSSSRIKADQVARASGPPEEAA